MTCLLRYLITCAMIFAIMGCVAPHVLVERAVIRNDTPNSITNDTPNSITDVVVRHEPTGKIARINLILPLRSFELGFSSKPMRGQRGIITWKEADGRLRKEELDLPYNRVFKPRSKNMILVYIIHPSGKVSVHLQDSDAGK